MNHSVGRVLDVVLAAARPQVAVLVPVALQVSVDRSCHSVAANVEFTILVEKGSLNVLLDDVAALVAVHLLCLDQLLDVVEVTADLDTTASVGVLARLDDPKIVAVAGILLKNFVVRGVVVRLNKLQELSIALTLLNVIR